MSKAKNFLALINSIIMERYLIIVNTKVQNFNTTMYVD